MLLSLGEYAAQVVNLVAMRPMRRMPVTEYYLEYITNLL